MKHVGTQMKEAMISCTFRIIHTECISRSAKQLSGRRRRIPFDSGEYSNCHRRVSKNKPRIGLGASCLGASGRVRTTFVVEGRKRMSLFMETKRRRTLHLQASRSLFAAGLRYGFLVLYAVLARSSRNLQFRTTPPPANINLRSSRSSSFKPQSTFVTKLRPFPCNLSIARHPEQLQAGQMLEVFRKHVGSEEGHHDRSPFPAQKESILRPP